MTSGPLDSLLFRQVGGVASPNNGLPARHPNEYPVLSVTGDGIADGVLIHDSILPETTTKGTVT